MNEPTHGNGLRVSESESPDSLEATSPIAPEFVPGLLALISLTPTYHNLPNFSGTKTMNSKAMVVMSQLQTRMISHRHSESSLLATDC